MFLDQDTGRKNGALTHAKLSKGVTKGNAIIMQKGDIKNPIFIAEGPETAATIANAFPSSTVFASLGIYNIKNLTGICQKHGNSNVIFAADNDGLHGKNNASVMKEAMECFIESGLNPINFKPKMVDGLDKTDWNDVLINKGISKIQSDFTRQIKQIGDTKTLIFALDNELSNKINDHISSIKKPTNISIHKNIEQHKEIDF